MGSQGGLWVTAVKILLQRSLGCVVPPNPVPPQLLLPPPFHMARQCYLTDYDRVFMKLARLVVLLKHLQTMVSCV